MPKLTAITVRAASRQPIGAHGFQEASVGLSFSVADDDPALEGLADHVSAELEAAFTRLWARLESDPEAKRPCPRGAARPTGVAGARIG